MDSRDECILYNGKSDKFEYSNMESTRMLSVVGKLCMTANGGCERAVVHRMNEGYKAWRALKSVPSIIRLSMNAMKYMYEGVIVPTALYRAEVSCMSSAERGNVCS